MDIVERLEQELEETTARLRHDPAAPAVDDGGAVFAEHPADALDGAQTQLQQEIAFATRSLLRERAQRLMEALERLRDGSYGICEECDEPIAPARLSALPEVTTCLACQRRREARVPRASDGQDPLFDAADI